MTGARALPGADPLSGGGLRLARRGVRWSRESSALAPLADWFRAVRERFSAD